MPPVLREFIVKPGMERFWRVPLKQGEAITSLTQYDSVYPTTTTADEYALYKFVGPNQNGAGSVYQLVEIHDKKGITFKGKDFDAPVTLPDNTEH